MHKNTCANVQQELLQEHSVVQGRIELLQGSYEHTHRMVTISLASPMAALMALLHKGVNACII